MMGRSHGTSGLAAGLGYGALLTESVLLRCALGVVGMVFAFLPDLDHLQSTVARFVPIVGPLLSRILRATSRAVYAATKGPRDEDCAGDHRHLSHTLVFALLVGAGMTFVAAWGMAPEGATRVEALHVGLLFGGAAALGCFVHCLGDALTLSGCPFLWPLPIGGETWAEIRPPRGLRFRTGGWVEQSLVFPALSVAVVLLLPGMWPFLATQLPAIHNLLPAF